MATPEQSAKSGGVIAKVFLIILLAGLLLCAYPFIMGGDSFNAIGMVVSGIFLVLMGLTGTVVMKNRKKAMDTILSGDSIIDQWEDADLGTIILSTEGFFSEGELYTMKGYSCSVKSAEIKGGELLITYLMARRAGHSKHKTNIPIPYGHEAGAERFIAAVTSAGGNRDALRDESPEDEDSDRETWDPEDE